MKKVLLLSVIIALSVYTLFADSTDPPGYGESSASTKIHFVYDKYFARIGFTAKELDASSLNVPDNLNEIVLITDYTTKAATSEAFYAYWQINNNKNVYIINLSSRGLQKEGVVDSCTWKVLANDAEVINQSSSGAITLYTTKTSDTIVNGSQKLVVTIENYHLLKAGNYTLPLTLELVTQ